jgi:hypothetical protein
MSVIDTLFFVFKGDTSDAEHALDRTSLKANKAEGAIGSLIKKGAATLGGVFAFGLLSAKVSETADQMNRLSEASDRMGLDVGDLDAWSRGIEDAGGSAESFIGTLKGLNSNIQLIKVKGSSRGLPFFEELGFTKEGIAKTKDVMELLPELADKLSKLDAQEAIGYGEKLGIDEATIGVLMQGRDATEAMIAAQKKLGVMTKEDKATVKEYDDAMDNLGRTFQQIWRVLALSVIPAIKTLADAMNKTFSTLKEHGEAVKAFGIICAVFIGGMAIAAVYQFIAAMSLMRAMAITTAIAEGLMMLPLILMIGLAIALSAALALLYEDFKIWTEGGDSLLGDHLGKWKDFKGGVLAYIDEIKAGWESFRRFFSDMGDNTMNLIRGKGFDVGDAKSGAVSLGSDISENASDLMGNAKRAYNEASGSGFNTSAPTQAGAVQKTNSTSVQTGAVTINTQATNAEGVAGAFSGWLEKHLKDATAGTDDGVAA